MKLAKIILTSAVAIMAAACSNPLEHQVMGKWTLQECEIDRIDSVCQARVEQSIASTKKAIDLLHHELDSTKVEAKKQELIAYEQELQSQLESYTPQKFKDEYNTLSKAQIGSMTITFKEKNQMQIRVAGADEQAGTWRVSGDTIITMFDNQPAEILIVKDVTSSNLKLFSPAPDERSVDLIMKFGKN